MKKVKKYLKGLLICQIIYSVTFIILIVSMSSLIYGYYTGHYNGHYTSGGILSGISYLLLIATGIASFVFSILLIVEHKNAKAKGLTLATGIVCLVLCFIIIPFVSMIMTIVCIIANKGDSNSNNSDNNNKKEEKTEY